MENTEQTNIETVKPEELTEKQLSENPVQEIPSKIDASNIKPTEGISIDLKKFDKKEVVIEEIEITSVPSNYTPLIGESQQHQFQWVLKISSGILETIERGELPEDNIEFRSSELFNLTQDKEGKLIGFPTGEGSNLMKFCNDLGIDKPEESETLQILIDKIKGQKVLIKAYTKSYDGKERTYLKFRY